MTDDVTDNIVIRGCPDSISGWVLKKEKKKKRKQLIYVLYILYVIYIVYILYAYFISYILHVYVQSKVSGI